MTKANTAHTTNTNATENDAPSLVSNVRSACVSSNTCLSANISMFLNAAGHFRWTKMTTRPPMAHAMYITMLAETAVALVLESLLLVLANVEKGDVVSSSLFSSWSLGLFASSVVVGVLDWSKRPLGSVDVASDVAPGGEAKQILDVHALHVALAGWSW